MQKPLILLIGLAALAGPAAAREITVPIAGRDDAAVKADIRHAAEAVCRESSDGSILATLSERACTRRVIAKTEADLARARLANARAAAQYAAAK